MIVEFTMLKPTHGVADRPSGGRCVNMKSRPALRMQEHDRCRLAGGRGTPIWKSSVLRLASLQVSQDMARQELNSNRIEDLAPADTGANRGVPPRNSNARRKVSKSNFFIILHPAIGNLRKQSMDLHPSVGCFKRERRDIGGYRIGENVIMAGPSTCNKTARGHAQQKTLRGGVCNVTLVQK